MESANETAEMPFATQVMPDDFKESEKPIVNDADDEEEALKRPAMLANAHARDLARGDLVLVSKTEKKTYGKNPKSHGIATVAEEGDATENTVPLQFTYKQFEGGYEPGPETVSADDQKIQYLASAKLATTVDFETMPVPTPVFVGPKTQTAADFASKKKRNDGKYGTASFCGFAAGKPSVVFPGEASSEMIDLTSQDVHIYSFAKVPPRELLPEPVAEKKKTAKRKRTESVSTTNSGSSVSVISVDSDDNCEKRVKFTVMETQLRDDLKAMVERIENAISCIDKGDAEGLAHYKKILSSKLSGLLAMHW